ncbi:hypothetical protein DICVIV_03766 [Dictyocaulus viviparus]|uniref:Uncharacterized protein n=1 Tax=Dictyocaulus viviparus TaxID=29172 RepID=A0A0D8Y254_DICVI|nr:hypothetical protein DICVIV_03766 [Dictyocaulus viviparus]
MDVDDKSPLIYYSSDDCMNELYANASSEQLSDFHRLDGIPMLECNTSGNGIIDTSKTPINSTASLGDELISSNSYGIPSLYTQAEYRSDDQQFDGTVPVETNTFDTNVWPTAFGYDDTTLNCLHLEDVSQTPTFAEFDTFCYPDSDMHFVLNT